MAEGTKNTKNSLVMTDRQSVTLDGVVDILAFDADFALLSTELGVLSIEGEELHIEKTDTAEGRLVLKGKVNALVYSEDRPSRKKGLFGRR